MNLIQFIKDNGKRAVGVIDGDDAHQLKGPRTVYDLAEEAIGKGIGLAALVKEKGLGRPIDARAILDEGRMLPPIDHPDPAHLFVTGTGLTHLGSASARDAMHKSDAQAA